MESNVLENEHNGLLLLGISPAPPFLGMNLERESELLWRMAWITPRMLPCFFSGMWASNPSVIPSNSHPGGLVAPRAIGGQIVQGNNFMTDRLGFSRHANYIIIRLWEDQVALRVNVFSPSHA